MRVVNRKTLTKSSSTGSSKTGGGRGRKVAKPARTKMTKGSPASRKDRAYGSKKYATGKGEKQTFKKKKPTPPKVAPPKDKKGFQAFLSKQTSKGIKYSSPSEAATAFYKAGGK